MFVKIFWNLACAEHGNAAKDIQKTADIGKETKKAVVEMIFANIFITSPNGIMWPMRILLQMAPISHQTLRSLLSITMTVQLSILVRHILVTSVTWATTATVSSSTTKITCTGTILVNSVNLYRMDNWWCKITKVHLTYTWYVMNSSLKIKVVWRDTEMPGMETTVNPRNRTTFIP